MQYLNFYFQRPTALAKLLGVYRIGFKNSMTNATMRQDVLVMENLFYEKKVNKVSPCSNYPNGINHIEDQKSYREKVILHLFIHLDLCSK
jgi:Phosphatidylinositol-4-phosphate 5-kinase